MRVFGSAITGRDTETSDIDLLVSVSDSTSIFDLGGFTAAVEEIAGFRVDVLTDRQVDNPHFLYASTEAVKLSKGNGTNGEPNGRFVIVPRSAPDAYETGGVDHWPAVRDALEEMLAECEDIVERGENEFNRPRSLTYRAAEAVIIRFDDIISNRIPTDRKDTVPTFLPIPAVNRTRNIVTHNYRAADKKVTWVGMTKHIPEAIREILAANP